MNWFCNSPSIVTEIRADCLGGGDDGTPPQVDCPCCTFCCDDRTGACEINAQGTCEVGKSRFTDETRGIFYEPERGATCDCFDISDVNADASDESWELSCTDTTCMSCNKDETICAHNVEYGWEHHEARLDIWTSTYQYVDVEGSGVVDGESSSLQYLNDTVQFKYWTDEQYILHCEVSVNGEQCRGCARVVCSDRHRTYSVNCDNVEGVGNMNACQSDQVTGLLQVIAWADPVYSKDNCRPRIQGV